MTYDEAVEVFRRAVEGGILDEDLRTYRRNTSAGRSSPEIAGEFVRIKRRVEKVSRELTGVEFTLEVGGEPIYGIVDGRYLELDR